MENITNNPPDHSNNNDVWDKIEVIKGLIDKPNLSSDDLKTIEINLQYIESKTQELDASNHLFFEDKLLEKLKILFPGDAFIQKAVQFSDSVELLIDGKNAYSEILHQIDLAQDLIEIHIFIWRNDEIGNRIAQKILEALSDPKRPNLHVNISKDAIGAIFEYAEQNKQSFLHPDISIGQKLQAIAVDFAYKNDQEPAFGNQKRSDLYDQLISHPRIKIISNKSYDHSKYYIFDSKTIITGGMNIGDEYMNWHDYMIKMEASPLLVQKLRQRLAGNDDFDSGASMEFVMNRPEDKFPNISESKHLPDKEIKISILKLLEYAKTQNQTLTIEMAYFGDHDITNKIIEVINSGIKVNIILPQKANVQDDLNKSEMMQILKKTENAPNLTIAFFPGMLHAKMLHVGDLGKHAKMGITLFGSANLNKKATKDLAELDVFIDDKDCNFTQTVKEQLLIDLNKSAIFNAPPKITFSRIKAFFEGIAYEEPQGTINNVS